MSCRRWTRQRRSKGRSSNSVMLVAALVVAAAASVAGPALAQELPRQSTELRFTTEVPDSSSGDTLAIDVRDPEDPAGKPPAVERIVQRFHRGTVIDTSVPPRCEASDPELVAQGSEACPEATRIGGGTLVVDLGAGAGPFPRLVRNRVVYFNADEELILFTETTNTDGPPIRTVTRVEVDRRAMTSMVAPVPAIDPEDPFLAIKRVRTRLKPVSIGRGSEQRSFIETPAACPSDATWTNVVVLTYRDGVTQADRTESPCTRARGHGRDDEQPSGRETRDNGVGGRSTEFPRGGIEAGRGGASFEPGLVSSELLGIGLAAVAGVALLGLGRRV